MALMKIQCGPRTVAPGTAGNAATLDPSPGPQDSWNILKDREP